MKHRRYFWLAIGLFLILFTACQKGGAEKAGQDQGSDSLVKPQKQFNLTLDKYAEIMDGALKAENCAKLTASALTEGKNEVGQEFRSYQYTKGMTVFLYHNPDKEELTEIRFQIVGQGLSEKEKSAFAVMSRYTIHGLEPLKKQEIEEKLKMSNWQEEGITTAKGDNGYYAYAVTGDGMTFKVAST